MNAVDVAEQLVTIGRRVQQVERQLRQPVVALEAFTQLGELWVDPVARLAALVAPHIHPPPARRPPAALRLPASERFDFLLDSPRDGSGTALRSPDEGGMDVPRDRLRPAAARERDLDPGAPLHAPGTVDTQHAPTGVLVGGVRLTRDRSSLLSLLQSNIQPTGAQPSSPAVVGRPARPVATTEPGDGAAGNRPVAAAGTPPVHWAPPWTADNSSLVPTLAGDEHSSRVGMSGGEPQRQAFGDYPALSALDSLSPSAGVVGSDQGWAGGHEPHATTAPWVHPMRGDTRRRGAPLADIATEQDAFDLWSGVTPALSVDVTNWDEPTPAPVPLSALQIDQILDALDDRLELLMLRAYGGAV